MADAVWEVNSSLGKANCYLEKNSVYLSLISLFFTLYGWLIINCTDTSYRQLQLSQFSQRNPAASSLKPNAFNKNCQRHSRVFKY
ncbi:hypothetical protein Mic7113_5113 [Allocoleopsis franciscana PCC 7113]|uniref:Uncharacterized protein n=1 Tax=Allocoleopsis franciscana PCC 7113 TaxID=1173027 RepID=K9WK27_9CYAN|nr:hypothetical protein Mic7113_5113 [Allocoleopsis franciscana PCC 7113]